MYETILILQNIDKGDLICKYKLKDSLYNLVLNLFN